MFRIKRIDHVAVCVKDIEDAAARYKKIFGVDVARRELVTSHKADTALLSFGDTSLELITPAGNETLTKFLEKRGPGIHHIAVEVEGLDEALTVLESLGVRLIDKTPRIGARGHRVAFIHPEATGGVLVELVEPAHG